MTSSTEVMVEGYPSLLNGSCRVIAEAGANHNNSIDRAIEMCAAAAAAGAWAIKFQFYKAGRLAAADSPKYWSDQIGSRTQFEAFQRSDHLDYEDYRPVAEASRDLGIAFFATPFDEEAVAALEEIGAPLYKIASGDITHRGLLREVARTGKPVLLSTGASEDFEVRRALEWLGSDPAAVVPLVCTLTYPTPDVDGHFGRIESFRRRFDPYLIGMSDHTLGPDGGLVAASLGAVCIEKHFTLDKGLGDVPDHAMSVDPEELASLVRASDRGALLRGSPEFGVRESEVPARLNARRSLVAGVELLPGDVVTADALVAKRPGTGIEPWRVDEFVGKTVVRPISPDTIVSEDDFS